MDDETMFMDNMHDNLLSLYIDETARELIAMVLNGARAVKLSELETLVLSSFPSSQQEVTNLIKDLFRRVYEKATETTCQIRHVEDIHFIIKNDILPKLRSDAQQALTSALETERCRQIVGWEVWTPIIKNIFNVLGDGFEGDVGNAVEFFSKGKSGPSGDILKMYKDSLPDEKLDIEWYAVYLGEAIARGEVEAQSPKSHQSGVDKNEENPGVTVEGQTYQHVQQSIDGKVKASQEIILQKVQDAIRAQVAEISKVINDGMKATNEQIARQNAHHDSSKAEILEVVNEIFKASQPATHKEVSNKIDRDVYINKSELISHIDKTIREAVMQSMSSTSEFGVIRDEVDKKIHQNMQTTISSLFNMELRLHERISAIETSTGESNAQLAHQCNALKDEVEKMKLTTPTPSFRATEKTFEQHTRDSQVENSTIEDLEKVAKSKTNVKNGLQARFNKFKSATPVLSIQVAEQTVAAHLKEDEQAKNVNNAAKKTDNLAFQVAFPGQDIAPTAAQLWEEIKMLRAEIKELKDTPPSSVASDPHSGNNGGAGTMEKQALEDWSFLKPSEKSVGIADDVATNAAVHGSDGDSESLQDIHARLVRGGRLFPEIDYGDI
ncbi:hypothetical protein HYFRA_00007563 [Hymenoscyphus fraxineus]|uniref:Uncharacterized protein n=1 Tax=Hymenoscyphus fraxineus TaxID=746836 RepID=A0A9N9PR82_9HELO|nr:hypothetical protein HYFRA_00007563 [Hymenoscyphus fraxineus]